jgi:hypothetical protein
MRSSGSNLFSAVYPALIEIGLDGGHRRVPWGFLAAVPAYTAPTDVDHRGTEPAKAVNPCQFATRQPSNRRLGCGPHPAAA